MPDRIQSFKALCKGGLHSSENHLELSEDLPGSATRLINYEVSLSGGYRRINGYQLFDDQAAEIDPVDGEGPVLGLAIYDNPVTFQTMLIGARKEAGQNEYHFYEYVPLSGWQKMQLPQGVTRVVTNGATGVTVKKIRHESFNFGGGNQICFVDGANNAIIYDGTTWYVLDPNNSGGSGSGGGQGQGPGGDQLIDYPSVVEVFENHLFLGGDILSLGVIVHSAPNDALNFSAAAGGGQITLGMNLVQFKPFRDNLFCFGRNSIKRVRADIGSQQAPFLLEPVTSNIGCIARDSVLELGGDLVFLAPDGLRPVAGTSRIGDVELETISRPIQGLVQDFNRIYDLDTLNGVVVRGKSQLRYFIGDDSIDVENSYGIIGGLRPVETSVQWEFGELLGIRASVCTSGYVGRQEFVLHGDYDGKVYRQEVGNSFDGRAILGLYQTPYIDFGDTEVRKVLRKINTFVRAEGPFTLNMSVQYDWNDPGVLVPVSYVTSSAGAPTQYNGQGVNYAAPSAVYAGVEKPVIQTSVEGSGFSTQVTYVNLGTDPPHSIQGIVFEFSVSGRR